MSANLIYPTLYFVTFTGFIFCMLQLKGPEKKATKSQLRQRKAEKIKGWLDTWIHGGTLPNAVVSIHEKGKEVFFHATGYASVERRIPCNRDTIFRIYSMTKPITIVAIFILIERQLLSVDDTLDKFLPEFKEMRVHVDGTTEEDHVTTEAARAITIQDLMTHTSGINYAFLTDHLCGRILTKKVPNNDAVNLFSNTPMKELSKYIADSPLCFQPGMVQTPNKNTSYAALYCICDISSFDSVLFDLFFVCSLCVFVLLMLCCFLF